MDTHQNPTVDQRNHFHRRKFFKILKFFIIILTIFVGIKAVEALKEYHYIGLGTPAVNVITVSGTGNVLATPDIADFSFTVSKDATTAALAQTQVAAIVNPVLAAIKAGGVADADVQTNSYNLSPKYQYVPIACPQIATNNGIGIPCPQGNQKIVGYTVSESVEVKVRKIDSAADIISKITALGVSDLSGPNFTTDDPTALQDQARAKAITDAESHAQTLAKELGVHLSRIVSFSDDQQPIYYNKGYAMDSAGVTASVPAPTPELPTGQNKITSNVTITYEID